MVVDDSAVVRGLVSRFLQEDAELEVVASCANGQRAVDELKRTPVDVIVLDIEMPVMDGMTALPKLLETQPGVQVVMASTLTRSNADVSLKAMAAGAADYIAKPSSTGGLHGTGTYQQELRSKVKALAQQHRRNRGGKSVAPVRPRSLGGSAPTPSAASTPASSGTRASAAAARPAPAPAGDGSIKLRPMPTVRPEVLAIGSSTGGPQALFKFLGGLGRITQPVLITQHMPATFTALLADHIGRQTKLTCSEGKDGDPLVGGHVYIAPGGKHMTVERDAGGKTKIKLADGPPENFCKPSVDPMLRSLAPIYGSKLLTVILTGMGSDGLKGSEVAVQAGGHVLAQDEATSVVWGMPRAVAKAGLCSAVLPLPELAAAVQKLIVRNAA
ncbi:chemotaxis response regulator protein-glutamate methylesterase [Rhodovibrio salinarum]|uniref:Protein-glutamate methylesterase/protein-glutamine glutaminase n=2 Tax=Rhodovibrio salinarum TaxID=1087 RepID=A0A934V0J0_9PROT|nr:chemotaxis response regulator protein-glutamate methylesterase [Rhodovibrio salinarum]